MKEQAYPNDTPPGSQGTRYGLQCHDAWCFVSVKPTTETKSIIWPGPGLLAYVVSSKFADHLTPKINCYFLPHSVPREAARLAPHTAPCRENGLNGPARST